MAQGLHPTYISFFDPSVGFVIKEATVRKNRSWGMPGTGSPPYQSWASIVLLIVAVAGLKYHMPLQIHLRDTQKHRILNDTIPQTYRTPAPNRDRLRLSLTCASTP